VINCHYKIGTFADPLCVCQCVCIVLGFESLNCIVSGLSVKSFVIAFYFLRRTCLVFCFCVHVLILFVGYVCIVSGLASRRLFALLLFISVPPLLILSICSCRYVPDTVDVVGGNRAQRSSGCC